MSDDFEASYSLASVEPYKTEQPTPGLRWVKAKSIEQDGMVYHQPQRLQQAWQITHIPTFTTSIEWRDVPFETEK